MSFKTPESTVELAICMALEARGYRVVKVPRAGYYDAVRKTFRKHANKWALNGFPDLVVFHKNLNGRFLGLEVKSEKGRQSDAQKQMQEIITSSGGFYFLIRNVEDAFEALKQAELTVTRS